MNKLVALLLTSFFAVSSFAASHAGAPMDGASAAKAETKAEKKAAKAEKKAAKAEKKEAKADAKAEKKEEAKK